MGYSRGPKAGVFETYENEDDRDKKVTGLKDTSVKETDAAGDKAKENTRSLEQEQHDTDKGYLDPNAGKNIAKGQGSYDMINNRDYGTTLRLAREADAYNNRRQEHYMDQSHWKAGGNRDMGTLTERPKIETMETRAMDQSFNLDTNQKQLAQALQDAVNHKDLDAFQQLYKQLYGIELDKLTAEMEMTKMARTAQISDSIGRRTTEWTTYFNRAVTAQTAPTIASLMRTDEVLANMMGWMLGNGAQTLSQDAALQTKFQNDLTNRMIADGISPLEAAQASGMVVSDTLMNYQLQYTDMVRDKNSVWNRGYNYFNGTQDFTKKYGSYMNQ